MTSSRILGSVPGRPGLPSHVRLAEMLAAADDPGLSLGPARTVVLEWVGQENPLDRADVRLRLMRGEYTLEQARAIREAAARAATPAANRRRVLEAGHDPRALAPVPGLSRTYCWERRNGYRVRVTARDADVILSSACGNEFVLR
ncbi:MAG: hypothetical protein ACKOWF_16095 [Chloroflexota bacterium]